MSESNACPECGASRPPDRPPGPCSRCRAGSSSSSNSGRPRSGPSPASAPVALPGFRRSALDLGLASAEELDRFAEGAGGDVSRMSRAMVAAGKLTAYQAGALSQGRARGLAIGPYLVLEKRGQGGMGVVFRARPRAGGPEVAVKILLPSFSRDREAVLRFRREFEVAAQLKHPNVVSALEAGEDRGMQYLTMEFVDGHDLDALVREVGPLPVKMSTHCAIQAARGLAAAHERGIVHRDVKPSNLMLDPSGAVRVLDLGLARVVEAANPLGQPAGPALTRGGAYLGTVDYVAPEQADDSRKADHRADIYALGCTLHFLLTGRPPFGGESNLGRLMAHQQEPAPTLLGGRGEVPEALEGLYQEMMAKRPADRPASMAEVAARLEACRASADEARQAGEGMKSFAEGVMKRAAPRKRERSRDASVFARPSEIGRVGIGADLRLEDVIDDYRDEARPGELDEARLPPVLPRIAPTRKRARRPAWAPVAMVALAALGLAWAGYSLSHRGESPLSAGPPSPGPGLAIANVSATARPEVAREPAEWTPLFNGKGLAGWMPNDSKAEDWKAKGGELVVKGRGVPYMALFTDRAYENFRFRFEFRASEGTNSGVILGGFDPAGHLIDISELNIGVPGGPRDETGLFLDGIPRRFFEPTSPRSVDLKSGDAWNEMEVSRVDGLLAVKVNGKELDYGRELTRIAEPRRIGLQGFRGDVRFRGMAIRAWKSDPVAVATNARDANRPPDTLFVDEFTGKSAPQKGPDGKPLPPEQVTGPGEGDGVYFIQQKDAGTWGYNIKGNLVDFSVEAVGRVLRTRANANGSWGLILLAEDRGLGVWIDTQGQYWIDPSFWTASKYPNDLRVGPISHPAIRPGNQFNTLKLNVRRRRLEVLINGILVCEPIRVDYDLTPTLVEAGLWVGTPRVRAEFDRMVFKTLPPDRSAPAPSPVGTWCNGEGRRLQLRPGGLAQDSLFPIVTWSQGGPVVDLHFRDYRSNHFLDRVELDGDGSHFRGANHRGDSVGAFRVADGAEFTASSVILNPIPGGEFLMGTTPEQVDSFLRQFPGAGRDIFVDEQPAHRVRITRPFYLGATEVTVGQFRKFVEASGYKTDAERDGRGSRTAGERGGYVDDPKLNWREPGFRQEDNHPVVNVSWNDAVAFCAWLGKAEGKPYRLPTEAEWEYACHAGTATRYATGDDPTALAGFANIADATALEKYPLWVTYPIRDHFAHTAPTAHLRRNAFGLYDMTGNAWEWCLDRYEATYYGQNVAQDPKGPAEGNWRVIRGGGWNYDAPSGRPADRGFDAPDRRGNSVGFRVARDLAPGERPPTP